MLSQDTVALNKVEWAGWVEAQHFDSATLMQKILNVIVELKAQALF